MQMHTLPSIVDRVVSERESCWVGTLLSSTDYGKLVFNEWSGKEGNFTSCNSIWCSGPCWLANAKRDPGNVLSQRRNNVVDPDHVFSVLWGHGRTTRRSTAFVME